MKSTCFFGAGLASNERMERGMMILQLLSLFRLIYLTHILDLGVESFNILSDLVDPLHV